MKKYYLFYFTLSFFFTIQAQKDTISLNEVNLEINKTKVKLQQLPASVTQIKAQKIENLQIEKTSDLNGIVPNVFMPDYGSKLSSPIYIRGVGSRINEPSVGLYVDDIPYFDKGTFNFELFDIDKIEILRGPQGTLYGRNTMGGLIRISSRNPEQRTKLRLQAGAGTDGQYKTGLHYNQRINKKLSLLLDAGYFYQQGFYTNIYDGKKTDENNTGSGRLKLLYQPEKNTKILFAANYENNLQNGYPYAVYNPDTQTTDPVNYDQFSDYQQDLFSIGLNLNHTGAKLNYKLSLSYQNIKDTQNIDQDFTENNIYYVVQNRENNYFIEEFNLSNKNTSKIQWVAGIFSFQTSQLKDVDVAINNIGMDLFKTYDQPVFGWAGFGEFTYKLKRLKFTAGLRYDYEKTSLKYNYDLTFHSNTSNKANLDLDLEYEEILPKFSISYTPDNKLNFYGTVAKGYKAGGFNSTIERKEDETYNPEYDMNYELGIKSQWLQKKLSINASIFYIDWKDQQIYQTVPSGRGSMLKNAGKSESKGLEFEINYKINKHFDLSFNYGRTEAKFIEYQKNDSISYSGNYIPFIPNCTAGASVNYHWLVKSKKLQKIDFNLNLTRIGKLYWNDANTYEQDPYTRLNSLITAHFKKFEFGLWGKNLLDTSYYNHFFTIDKLHKAYVQPADPRQFGIIMKYTIL